MLGVLRLAYILHFAPMDYHTGSLARIPGPSWFLARRCSRKHGNGRSIQIHREIQVAPHTLSRCRRYDGHPHHIGFVLVFMEEPAKISQVT